MIRKVLSGLILLAVLAIMAETLRAASAQPEMVVCGWDEVFVLRLKPGGATEKTWSWRADDRSGLPDSMRAKFATTDDCKPVDGGRRIVVTSSSEGVALVERSSGRAAFFATAANAHSAELLPGNLLAVAASHAESGAGDRLIIYDLSAPGRELADDPLPWGHGVVWDDTRKLLYALADSDIRIYNVEYVNGSFRNLSRQALIALPEGMGHELQPVPGTSFLAVSTTHHCWLFDRDNWRISPHPVLADSADVKSISVDPASGRLAWTRAEGKDWWTSIIRMQNPKGTLVLPGERLYKVRWITRE